MDVVGFCFLDLAKGYKPPDDMVKWLGAGKPPIYIGFGSLVSIFLLPNCQPTKLQDVIALKIPSQEGWIKLWQNWDDALVIANSTMNVFLRQIFIYLSTPAIRRQWSQWVVMQLISGIHDEAEGLHLWATLTSLWLHSLSGNLQSVVVEVSMQTHRCMWLFLAGCFVW